MNNASSDSIIDRIKAILKIWSKNGEVRLRAGELTSGEMRAVRACLDGMSASISSVISDDNLKSKWRFEFRTMDPDWPNLHGGNWQSLHDSSDLMSKPEALTYLKKEAASWSKNTEFRLVRIIEDLVEHEAVTSHGR